MTGISFAAQPRQIVVTPSGARVLVLVRRNADPEPPGFVHRNLGLERERNVWRWLTWLIRRDGTWLVELFLGATSEAHGRPGGPADEAVVVADRRRAEGVAARASVHLARDGRSVGLLRRLADPASPDRVDGID